MSLNLHISIKNRNFATVYTYTTQETYKLKR